MKTAIYIEDGVTQLVLTPETKYERDIVAGVGDRIDQVKVFQGGFYDCRGGWVRQTAYRENPARYKSWDRSENASLIIRLDKELETDD